MKILVISDYRATVIVRPEAEIFVGLKERGHDITVMTYGGAEYISRFEEKGIRVIPFHPEKKFNRKSIAFIREELVKGGYDILQMFNSLGYTNGIWAAKGIPVKVVLYRSYTGNITWHDPFLYLKYFHPRVDGIVCNVEAIRHLFIKNAPYLRHKLKTINKGHDLSWYQVNQAVNLEPFGVKKGDIKFVCAANDRKMKGLKYLLKATHYLDKDSPVHLFLAGNGMDKPEFVKLINESPIKDRIHILGFRNDILEFVNACDVFVLASLFGEAITKAVIEAMCLSLAPLITDIPGNKGLVISGESGLVVEAGNAQALAEGMKTYISQPELIKKYGNAAKNRIQTEFNTKKTVEGYESFYYELKAVGESSSKVTM